jgi:conjugal transfer pilus assembly protein TraF
MKPAPTSGKADALALAIAMALATLAPDATRAQAMGRPYWSDAWRGWHFYEEPEPQVPEAPASGTRPAPAASSTAAPPPRAPSKPPEIVEFEQLQRALEQRRHIAIMRPTEANVRHYMELEAQVVARASSFAHVAQRLAWASPELDPSLQGRPVNAKALEVFDRLQMTQRHQSISALAPDHVLFFFFRSDCPYCHAIAPTLEAFQARHGIKVVAISVDGGSIPGFADARRDNGIATALRVSQVPAVYLAQPFTGKITPIGFGVLSEAQLIERLSIVAAVPAEAEALAMLNRHSQRAPAARTASWR